MDLAHELFGERQIAGHNLCFIYIGIKLQDVVSFQSSNEPAKQF